MTQVELAQCTDHITASSTGLCSTGPPNKPLTGCSCLQDGASHRREAQEKQKVWLICTFYVMPNRLAAVLGAYIVSKRYKLFGISFSIQIPDSGGNAVSRR